MNRDDTWPSLPFAEWKDTCATLHLWTQIVGKVRLALAPWTNHSWHVTLYLTARGLTTSPIPHGTRVFQIDFDFVDHKLLIVTAEGETRSIELKPQSVAEFYQKTMSILRELNLPVSINTTPNEIANPIPFERDEVHRAYDPEYANRFWRVLLQTDRVFKEFRSRFCGKCSPVHFFWGAPGSCRNTLFRTRRAAASGRNSEYAGRDHTRSLFARSEQSRFLAGQRRDAGADFLFIRLSRAERLFRSQCETSGRIL